MTNRRRNQPYRFNGSPHLDEKSIRTVGIDQLIFEIEKFRRKLADPRDKDDPSWTRRWLARYERELAKKQHGLANKQRQRALRPPRFQHRAGSDES